MALWDELKAVLARLAQEQEPGTLRAYPDPRQDQGGEPPFEITLAPWAADVAEDLRRRFGDEVDLTVGVLPYPLSRAAGRVPDEPEPAERIDPEQVEVELDGPAVVRSGHSIRHGLIVRNLGRRALAIATNGALPTTIADPGTGETVGGCAGPRTLLLKTFPVPPGEARTVPLDIETASFDPRLGYAVPPGTWAVRAELSVGSGDSALRSTPLLPLTVTA
jgi:hypothetical protein